MMLSLPSFLAAETSASRPPQSVTDVAVLGLHVAVPLLVVPPHAPTTTNATTARPSRRVRLLHFMFLPLYRNRPTWQATNMQGKYCSGLACFARMVRAGPCFLVSPPLIRSCYPGNPAGVRGRRQL